MKLITIFSSISATDVQLAKAVLENEGIQAVIADYNLASIAPHLAMGGIRLQIKEEDYAAAKKIMDDYMHSGNTEGEIKNDET